MKEHWKPITGHEGRYEVSDLGRVRSLLRGEPYIMNGSMSNMGYRLVMLRKKNGRPKDFSVHRLVALHFVPNPNNLPIVNHKDENKLNNRADNLEWCDHYYNRHYGTADKRQRERQCKPIGKYTKEGVLVEVYPSPTAAATANGLSYSAIRHVAEGYRNTAMGFVYKYVDK